MFRGGPEGFFGVHNVDVKGIVDVEHSASVDKVPGRKLHIKIGSLERNLPFLDALASLDFKLSVRDVFRISSKSSESSDQVRLAHLWVDFRVIFIGLASF